MLASVGSWLLNSTAKFFYAVSPWDLALDDSDPEPKWLLERGFPMFIVFIVLEAILLRLVPDKHDKSNKRLQRNARMNDVLASTILGSVQTVWLLLLELVNLSLHTRAYRFAWTHFRLFDFAPKDHVLLCYFGCMIGKDLGYYWMHRMLHEFHIMWSAHSVHHSGEDYNLGMALRQGALQPVFGWIFYIPCALLGFHPVAFSAHAQLNTLYMFLIHTDLIGRLPFGLEYVLNSPMAHRMHHRPPGNCNYGGLLIIWDRIFCTYQAEHQRRDWYGLAQQPQTFDPLTMNTQHLAKMRSLPSWLSWLTARRVPARWRLDIGALFRPIPQQQSDRRAEGTVRKVFDGETPVDSALTRVQLSVASVAALLAGLAVLLQASSLHRWDAILATCIVLSVLTMASRAWDNRKTDQFSAPASFGLLCALGAVLTMHPAASL